MTYIISKLTNYWVILMYRIVIVDTLQVITISIFILNRRRKRVV